MNPPVDLERDGRLLDGPSLAAALAAGSAALFPTDTLPALACLPATASQLWELKGRPMQKPLILMGAEPEALFAALALPVLPAWRSMAAHCWPGAVTLVLPAQGAIVAALQPEGPAAGASLGLRIPACGAALALLERTGPLATTSANRSAQPPCLDAASAAATFPSLPLLAPVPWPVVLGEASTVIRWNGENDWQVLRAGAVIPEGCRP
ncbi:Sua5/YciO/YrdC/YwlC family protein [Synechococcus sp. CS-1325]|uniref:L-threonylcarbamoyladenylate synthase n=1 Tax=unclassified Synechococcus TaxID=2626047 RepID=UPI000DB824E6|nr:MULTISPECIES: Sua5/YciO/YrdC/YwlC family protein [unclassified Synechococcus]PZV00045.1 MAG: translation factor [Cyanobium sp.]MCT0198854.1 Sua5/YciO/YrdC/YwlC family protein [Synechococcus sp. CS-1325]MCT0214054.1 Sua5/YciO/YrdC/YwlC family protein [Synechococcus sp. CS-1326]MCT0231884.1 Sua5/YciO/YrdC/YwlC family protein [Synechococcus sp. CS-1324]MCT0234141.1 Sua5/YciO/YrdC/YwlC family protein [Synechococcus sp. CS-1327]